MFFVADAETLNNKFAEKEDAEAFALRRGGLILELVGQTEKPEVEENVWTEGDRERYKREVKATEAAWAKTNNQTRPAAVDTNSGFRSLFDKPASYPSGYDPDESAKRRAESIGNRYLKSLGYRPDREAAILVALQLAAWEREHGNLFESPRSPVDWVIELGQDSIGNGEPWVGRHKSESQRRREQLRQEDRRRMALEVNRALRELLERECPRLQRLPEAEARASVRIPDAGRSR